MQSQETQTGWLVNAAGYSECSAFPLQKRSQLLSVLVGYREGVPKSSTPATQDATPQAVSRDIRSLCFAEEQTHVEDKGGMSRLKQSGQRGK